MKFECFLPKIKGTSQANYIYITSDSGCYSAVGMIGGRQELSLDTDDNNYCIETGTAMHEFMHALGME